MQPDFFVHPRPSWPSAVQRANGVLLLIGFVVAVVAIPVALFNEGMGTILGVLAFVIVATAALVLGVGIGFQHRHELQRQAALQVFLEARYPDHFSARKLDKFSYGGSLAVADNGMTRQRIWLGAITIAGEPLLSKEEHTGKLFKQWIGV